MEAAAKVALPLSLSHSLISDSKQRQLVIWNMLADLLCLPDNQRSFTVFIFSLLFWKLNELADNLMDYLA